jgi:lysophospholipid acyltransferase (LPLAT)-like uncharacterized protein
VSVASAKSKSDPWAQYMRWRRYGVNPPLTLKRRVVAALVSVTSRAFFRITALTCRVRITGDEAFRADKLMGKRGAIFVMWHNRLSMFAAYDATSALRNPDYRMFSLISASDDGELLARTVREGGGYEIRGSSSRGGAEALREAIKVGGAGANVSTVGDGPRGPRYKLKPGPLLMARATGLPVIPVSWSCTRAFQLHRSWDQMLFPLPRSTIELRFGEPMRVPHDASAEDLESLKQDMQTRLDVLTEWADRNTRVAIQFPKPRPGEILKRRK